MYEIHDIIHTLNIHYVSIFFMSYPHTIVDHFSRPAVLSMVTNIAATAILNTVTMIPFIKSFRGSSAKLFAMSTMVRYFRLIPISIFFIMIIIVTPLVTIKNSGMFHDQVMASALNTCSPNIIYDMLFITNWFPIAQHCIPVNWFLSADFQLAMITFLLIVTLASDSWKGIKLASFYVAAGIPIKFYMIICHDRRIINRFYELSSYDTFHLTHTATDNYISPYAVALTFGILIHRGVCLEIDTRFNNLMQMILIAFLVSSTLFTQHIDDWECDLWIKRLIGSTMKTFDCIAVSSIFYPVWASESCILKSILTFSHYLNSISKIILPSFICHYLFLVWTASIRHSNPIEYSFMYLVGTVLFVLPLTLIGGLIIHILVELPFMKLMKSMLVKKKE